MFWHSVELWVAANCAALPTANAGQYATLNCKSPLFWFSRKAAVGLYNCPDL